MQFLILAHDAKDSDAPERRMNNRDAHLAVIARYKAQGHMKMGAAILDEAGKMIGSCIIADFPSRTELDAWLAEEPYIAGKVWENIQISNCRIAPSFVQP
jgi:uncharacterized protein